MLVIARGGNFHCFSMFGPPVSCHILAKRLMSGGLAMEWPGSAEGAAPVRAVPPISSRSTRATGGHPMVSPPETSHGAGVACWTQSVLVVIFVFIWSMYCFFLCWFCLPTFGWSSGQMWLNIPYMEHMGFCRLWFKHVEELWEPLCRIISGVGKSPN